MQSMKNQSDEAIMARLLLEGSKSCASCANNYFCSYAVNPSDVCINYLNIKTWFQEKK